MYRSLHCRRTYARGGLRTYGYCPVGWNYRYRYWSVWNAGFHCGCLGGMCQNSTRIYWCPAGSYAGIGHWCGSLIPRRPSGPHAGSRG